MRDQGKTHKASRREFIELLTAGAVGATVAGVGAVEEARADTFTGDRSRYKIYSPGRIGTLKLKNRLVRSAAYEGGGLPTGEVNADMLRMHRAYAEGGVSLTITGYMAVMEYGKNCLLYTSDAADE